jgi:hypothetical protein
VLGLVQGLVLVLEQGLEQESGLGLVPVQERRRQPPN